MFTSYVFDDIDNTNIFIPHNIVSLSYTDLTKNEPSLPHSHQFTEIMIVTDGNGELLVNNTRIPFNKGKLYFINPNTEHSEVNADTSKPLKYYVLKIRNFSIYQTAILTPCLETEINYSIQKQILSIFTQTMEDYNIKSPHRKNLLALDLAYLYYYFVHILEDKFFINHTAVKRNSSKVQAMINYISANYGLDLKVSNIARQFSLSHNTVINLFQKETGMPPSAFIARQRMQAAKSLLKNTDYTITQIADLCGYSLPSFFSKAFRASEGISPSQYRKKAQK